MTDMEIDIPYLAEYNEYCNTHGEWPALKEKLEERDNHAIQALLGYLDETEVAQGTFCAVLWRKAWWEHELCVAVGGWVEVEFPNYQKWLWVQITNDQGGGSTLLHPNYDPNCRYTTDPLGDWEPPKCVNKYDETSDEFEGYYELGQSRL